MTAFRKKPVVIEAWLASDLIRAAESCWADLPRSVASAYEGGGWLFCSDCLYIHTLEGSMRADRGDMVIRGVAGEFYPCRADIFAATYEACSGAATEPAAPAARVLNADEEEKVDLGFVDWIGGRALKSGTLLYTVPQPADPDGQARLDAAYLERNQVVAALAKCFPSGVARTAIEGWSDDWQGCVYIDLPTGQASWHFHDSQAALFESLPAYDRPWDGHDTPEKYRRLAALQVAPAGADALNARRYRYLRNLPLRTPIPGLDVSYWNESYEGEPMRGEELDAKIDGELAAAARGAA